MTVVKSASSLAPVWAWLRLDVRRRWRSLVVLALLVALASAVVSAATAGARRGGSAVDRLYEATLAATVLVAPQTPDFPWEQVRRLPGVEAVGTFVPADDLLYLDRVETFDEEIYWSRFAVGDADMTRTVERPAVLAGRLADQNRVDEAMVTASFSERHHLRVGDTVTARLFTPQQADANYTSNAIDVPGGPRQPLRVVGVVRSPVVNSTLNSSVIMVTAAFTRAYSANLLGAEGLGYYAGAVRLTRGEAGLADFQRQLADVTKRDDITVQNLVEDARRATGMTGFERNALLLFALTALVASAVVLGQAAARYAAASAADVAVLRALGMSALQAAAATASGPAFAAVVGVVAAVPAAVAASGLFPIGTAADYEPDPGMHVDVVVLAGTAAVVVVVVGVAVALGAWRALAGARSAATPRRSVVAAAAYRLGLPVPVVFGTRLALEPGRGPTAVPVRPALAGAVVGVLGVLAALTFHAGVADAADNPQRFGQTYQIEGWIGENSQEFKDPDSVWRAFAADPDVVAVNDTRIGSATVNGLPIDVFSHQPAAAARPLPIVTLSGRMPVAPDEITLAPDTVREAGAHIGDILVVAGTASAPTPMRVTGIAFVPSVSYGGYAMGAWTTGEGFTTIFPRGFLYHFGHAALRVGADAEAVAERLNGAATPREFRPAHPPQEIQQLGNVRVLPLALGGFLALLAVTATGHALATAARRRRNEIAILRALGTTGRQSRLIVVTQATVLAVVGMAFGVPLGVALGRTVWQGVADSVPVLYVPPVAQLALALVVPVALLVGVVLAAVPAHWASHLNVGDVLRAE